jgi:hypothetical protein
MMWIMKYFDGHSGVVRTEVIDNLQRARDMKSLWGVSEVRVWVLETEKLVDVAV